MDTPTRQANGKHRQHSPAAVETWTTPVGSTVRAADAGEVVVNVDTDYKPKKTWWQRMSEISEKTRIILNWGGAILVVGAVFFAGRVVESWQQGLSHGEQKNAEQDARLDKLESAVLEIKDLVKDGRRVTDAAAKDAATAAGNTNGIIYDLGELKARLAERGISWPNKREESP